MIHDHDFDFLVPRSLSGGATIYWIMSGVTSDVGIPSTHLGFNRARNLLVKKNPLCRELVCITVKWTWYNGHDEFFHITSGQINTWKGVNQLKELFFSCDQAAIWLVQSVRLSVRPSIRPSVCLSHLFHHVPIIVSSWNFQELLPWSKVMSVQKVKVRGQRSRSQWSTPNLAVSGL